MPTRLPKDLGTEAIALAVEADKKAAGGKIRYVCLEAIGRTRFERLTAQEIAAAIVE